MKTKCMSIAVLAAAVVLAPSILAAQMDQNGVPGPVGPQPYPNSPQGINQPTSNQGASTPPNGAQVTQTTSMRDSLGNPGQMGQQMLDKQFVRSAAQGGLADVKLGQLATEKGSADVKELSQKLVDDHTAMNKDMDAIADSLGVMLPKKMTKDDQAEYEKLNGLSGKDFDTEYLTYIAKAHWQTLHAFYMEASVAADPELQAEVVKALGIMHQHVGMISKTAKAEDITLPPRPQRPAPTTASK
jgi:putative membrane protein